MHLGEYDIREQLRAGPGLALYRATRRCDGAPVLLKVAEAGARGRRRAAELRHEYRLLARLPSERVVQALALEEQGRDAALVLEDFGGAPLAARASARLDLEAFLGVARRLCEALEVVHRHGIIHKNISPQNVFVDDRAGALKGPANAESGPVVKLADFSIASLLTREAASLAAPRELSGTLAYMAPEQTGRMNRGIDQRSDLYALGVVYYELLAGRLPFGQTDPLELVHAHIAQAPAPLEGLGLGVPPVIAGIVAKLLAKNAEDRYQSAGGLRADLDACAALLREQGRLGDDFTPGERDPAGTFRLVEKLYGRAEQGAKLLAAFERAAAGACTVVLVSGYSGAGKSSLVNEVHKPIVARRGHFVAGKIDQYNRTVPFASLLRAFEELVAHALASEGDEGEAWRARLRDALGPAAAVLVETLPAARALVGDEPPPSMLTSPAEAQNRIEHALLRFLSAFARPDHPLVVFLDDLQWADGATLRFLQAIAADPGVRHLLLIGAYRDHEVGPTHPLTHAITSMRAAGGAGSRHAAIDEIILAPLDVEHVASILSDTLGAPPEDFADLAREVHRRTRGNPFFVKEFLRFLHHEGLVAFDPDARRWRWDLARIETSGIPEDAVDLITGELRKLRPETLDVLKLAACLGTRFDSRRLGVVHGAPVSDTLAVLWEALEKGLILPLDPDYRLLLLSDQTGDAPPAVPFRFLHDRVRQAAYSLIPEEDLPALRLRLGRRLLADARVRATLADELFDVVDHLNAGAPLVEDPDEREEIARLDLSAGRRSKASTAYESAARYAEAGVSLLGPEAWEREPALVFSLRAERAECAYLNGQLEQAEAQLAELSRRARTSLERAHVCNLQMALCTTSGRAQDALDVGLRALAALGVRLPDGDASTWEAAEAEHAAVRAALSHRRFDALIHAPPLVDPDQRAALKILINLLAPANLNHPALFSLCAATQVNLSMKYGHSDESPYGYMVYGMHLATSRGRFEEAYAFGRLALELDARLGHTGQTCRLNFVFGSYLHFLKPLREVLGYLDRAYMAGLESGDYIYLSYACSHILMLRLALGDPLDAVADDADRFLLLMQRTQVASSTAAQTIAKRVIEALRGRTESLGSLSGGGFLEDDFVASIDRAGLSFARQWYDAAKTELLYLAGDPAGALAAAATGEAGGPATEFYFATERVFYGALAAAALCGAEGARPGLLETFERYQTKIETWAGRCPENYRHKALLVAAEQARVLGDELAAVHLYEQAIASAAEHGFVFHEALASELAAAFHLARGRSRIASAYMRDAIDGYQRWGATGKLTELRARYADLLRRRPAPPAADGEQGPHSAPPASLAPGAAAGADTSRLDLLSVIKASQAFSVEVELDRLLQKIMHIVIENAGAERGVLLLDRDGELHVVAELHVHPGTDARLEAQPLSARDDVPQRLVRSVHRTGEPVVLSNASRESARIDDAYVARRRPRSVLCVPIRHQGKPLGVLYLENNLAAGAFTADRIEVLELLTAQVAISLEHAVFYEQIVAARKAAEAASRAKSAFLANMSHELRTPLNAIIGYSELLDEEAAGRGDADLSRDLGRIQTAGRHLLELINNILDLSKIEADRLDVSVEPIALATLIDEAVATIAPALQRNEDVLRVIYAGEPGPMESDKTKVRQILVNVLGNAAKFTSRGEVTLTVRRQEAGSGAWIRMDVADTGIGMTAEQASRVFDAFHQADASTTRKYGGTGLGLTISRRLCQLLGGEISVESELGRGSVFTIALPAIARRTAARGPGRPHEGTRERGVPTHVEGAVSGGEKGT